MKIRKKLAHRTRRRGFRVGNRIRRDAAGRPRLSVFRSERHIYAQVIDDAEGRTLAAASSLDTEIAGPGKLGCNCDAAAKVGSLIASRAKEKGVTTVVFDRGRFRYHGRVAALAAAAREGGLEF